MDPAELWLPTLVVSELKYGIDIMEDGRRRKRMEAAFRKLTDIAFVGRIIGFDLDAAVAAAAIGADRKKRGRPSGEVDTLIAGIAVSRKAAIATRNVAPLRGSAGEGDRSVGEVMVRKCRANVSRRF